VNTLIVSKSRVLITIIVLFAGSFLFFGSCKKSVSLPVLTTGNATGIIQTSAISGGNITSDGGASITSRGICWSTSNNPTVSDNIITEGSGTGSFTGNLTNLSPNTLYYVRAFATNSAGTSYGNQIMFTTEQTSVATLTTDIVSLITSTTAFSGGNITSDGGETVTVRGVCWSTSQNPTISDSKTADGTGAGIFTSSLMGLSTSTAYYLRAYATNNIGTAYGNQVNFTTLGTQGANEVLIQNMAFDPVSITVTANTTVTWTNKDGVAHTVTSDTNLFDSGTIGANGTYSHTFSTTGTYTYHCTIHPYMVGAVIVN
jgi:plastocyanin